MLPHVGISQPIDNDLFKLLSTGSITKNGKEHARNSQWLQLSAGACERLLSHVLEDFVLACLIPLFVIIHSSCDLKR